uniref:Uncharacterized protein n=1 Tax=Anguilla anguilla TaxID=7936 RepID=A0A0E9SSS4_ANGAN
MIQRNNYTITVTSLMHVMGALFRFTGVSFVVFNLSYAKYFIYIMLFLSCIFSNTP